MRSVGKTEKPPRGTRIGRFPGAHVFRSTLQAWTARLDDGQVLSVVEGKLSLLEKQAETREINQYCSSKKTIDDAMILREGKEQVKWSCADYVTMIKLKLLTRSKTDRPKMPSKKEDGKSLWETLQNDPDPQPPQPPPGFLDKDSSLRGSSDDEDSNFDSDEEESSRDGSVGYITHGSSDEVESSHDGSSIPSDDESTPSSDEESNLFGAQRIESVRPARVSDISDLTDDDIEDRAEV
jgi:hypothetical protein